VLNLNGQWASEPLINNEQFGLGGTSGVRGYQEGIQLRRQLAGARFSIFARRRSTSVISRTAIAATFPPKFCAARGSWITARRF
jgi:hypothetical protein